MTILFIHHDLYIGNLIKHNLNLLEYGQGGLLDVLYKDGQVYISYTENRSNCKTSTSIA